MNSALSARKYYYKHRIKILKKMKKYRKTIKCMNRIKRWIQLHREELLKNKKIYRLKNKKEIAIYRKKYNLKHRKHNNCYAKKYYDTHKLQNKIWRNKRRSIINLYMKNRKRNNINIRILSNLRKRIWDALKLNYKPHTTLKLIGCSVEFLKCHLESLFTKGMTWENYGKWHVDHIRPCISFDFSKPEEQRKCFHYKNLQPLWAEDNLKKHCRR